MSVSMNHQQEVTYGLSIGTDIDDPNWMALNGVIALILRYFIEFDIFAGRLHNDRQI